MKRIRVRKSFLPARLLASAGLFVLALMLQLLSPSPTGADASGCTGYAGSPAYAGRDNVVCTGGSGWCYECIYYYGGSGYTKCAETPGGDGYCLDFQSEIPPFW